MVFKKYKDGSKPYYIHSGSMIIKLKSNKAVYDIAALASYGYTTFGSNPTFSVTGDLSFTFSSGTYNYAEDYTSN